LIEQSPSRAGIRARLDSWAERVQSIRGRYATAEAALFFIAGFAFDVVTLSRIDDWLSVSQQGVYLLLLGALLVFEAREALGVGEPPAFLRKAWRFREAAVHFLFGSLLSLYALLYLKSASSLASLAFLFVLFAILVANELPVFRKLGVVVRSGLYGLCLTSYFAYLLPMLAGFIAPWLFVSAVALSMIPAALLSRALFRWNRASRASMARLVAPAAVVPLLLLGLYAMGAVPPVPLALQFIGIYHGLERDGSSYRLLHQRPKWRFWHHGDQLFWARPGDRIFCFLRLFAPTRFRDQVNIRWSFDDPQRGWTSTGLYPMVVTGGREGGFRGYAFKDHYQPGRWRVTVETVDGREVGSIRFEVRPDDGLAERSFQADRQ
jgi:hypothetical protein